MRVIVEHEICATFPYGSCALVSNSLLWDFLGVKDAVLYEK